MMRKTITCFLTLAFITSMSAISFAQNGPIDFETGGYGADWTWTVFENDSNPPVEIIENPDMSGDNTSATVAQFTALQTGQPWAGCESQHGADIGTFTLDSTNCIVKIMVWKPVISDVGIKFVKANSEALPELKVANTVINQWEELTFDFSGRIDHPATIDQDQIVVFPDFNLDGRTQTNICYFDNITFSEKEATATGPDVAAPAPTAAAEDVISLFSNAYTDVTVDTWSADWDVADVADVQVADDDVKLYTNLSYAGIEFTSETIDASEMTHFHMDIWTPDPTSAPAVFKVKLVDFGADGAFGGDDNVEHELVFNDASVPALATGEWVSIDVPLSSFTGLTTKAHLAQLVISGDPNTVYVDNVYFYAGEVLITEPEEAAPAPTAAADDVISLFSNAYTDVTVDTWSPDWDGADVADVQIAGDDVKLYTNLSYACIEFTSETIDASEMTHFNMDIWTPDPTAAPAVFKVKLVDFGADGAFGGDDDVEHELVFNDASVPALATGEWVSIDVPLSSFTGLTTKAHLAQIVISGNPNTVYVDNVYLYTTGTAIREISGSVPSKYALDQNYPNPFNPSTKIRFSLPEANQVTIKVHNLLGQEVATLMDAFTNAGSYEVTFNGAQLPTGTYLYSITAGNYVSIRKMVLIK